MEQKEYIKRKLSGRIPIVFTTFRTVSCRLPIERMTGIALRMWGTSLKLQ
jgi:hypothetical protein